MRRTVKILAVNNITSSFNTVSHKGKVGPDAKTIWEDSLVFSIDFTINYCDSITPEGEEIVKKRAYRARVELMNGGDYYLWQLRDMLTPREIADREDLTKPLHFVISSNVRWVMKDYNMWKHFNKIFKKATGKEVHQF